MFCPPFRRKTPDMDPQLLVVAVIVSAAGAYLGRSTWRAWRGARSGCGSTCGGGAGSARLSAAPSATTHIPLEQLTLRRPNDLDSR